MHRLLARQLGKLSLDRERLPPSLAKWQSMLDRIAQAYADADEDRYRLELSLSTTSDEMRELNEALQSASESELARQKVALEHACALAHAIEHSVAEGVLAVGSDGQILSYNRRFLELWSLTDLMLREWPPRRIVEHVSMLVCDPTELSETVERFREDMRSIRRDDVELLDGRIYERYTAPIETPARDVRGRIWCFRDVTEERRLASTRARLLETERTARTRIGLLYRLASRLGRAGAIEDLFEPAVEAACAAFGVERASVLLTRDGALQFRAHRGLSDAYRRSIVDRLSHDPHQDAPIIIEDVYSDPGAERARDVFICEGIRALAAFPMLYEGQRFGNLVVYDAQPRAFYVDEIQLGTTIAAQLAQALSRRIAEAETQRARAAAEEAARAREELLAIVAHDLRNPLGVVQLAAQSLLDDPVGFEADAERRLQMIYRNATRMARLIRDLLDAAAIESRRLSVVRERVAASTIVSEACELAKPLTDRKSLRLECVSNVGSAMVLCDLGRVLQVLSNLIGNAIDFSPAAGTVAIEATATAGDVVLAVCDEGPGIPPPERERIFERGVRVGSRRRDGIGFGLFIAQGLVLAHQGRIWVDPSSSAGTRIVVSLPRADLEAR